MKIGVAPINMGIQSGAEIIRLAQLAEKLGYESIWTGEHVLIPVDIDSKYPYTTGGQMPLPPETNCVDPLITLAAVASATSTIRLCTGVNILPQTNPIYMAKQAASLDFISNGRLLLGLGIGWMREEFEALGVPFERRGARFDDYLQGMRKIWSGDVVEHESDFISWSGFKSYPLPVQKRLPVLIGGSKGKAFERVAKYGDGWYVPPAEGDPKPEVLEGQIDMLRKACDEVGRDMSEIEIICILSDVERDGYLAQLEDIGVSHAMTPVLFDQRADDVMCRIAENVIRQ